MLLPINLWVNLSSAQMKLLFSGSDTAKIELVRQKLIDTHIACEIRREPAAQEPNGIPYYPELWVLNDRDFGAAARVFVRIGCTPSR
jgi:hypothetical protein